MLHRAPDGPVRYVGRSDTDLAERLRRHAKEREYGYFKFEYVPPARAAFEAECPLFHRHEETIENAVHPERPPGTDYFCPRCGRFQRFTLLGPTATASALTGERPNPLSRAAPTPGAPAGA